MSAYVLAGIYVAGMVVLSIAYGFFEKPLSGGTFDASFVALLLFWPVVFVVLLAGGIVVASGIVVAGILLSICLGLVSIGEVISSRWSKKAENQEEGVE